MPGVETPGSAAQVAAGGGTFVIREPAGGRLELAGALTFATARQARRDGLRLLSGSSVREMEVDCGGITASDSAGLTVLLDWLSFAKREGRSLRLLKLPEQILAVARISDVEQLLEAGV